MSPDTKPRRLRASRTPGGIHSLTPKEILVLGPRRSGKTSFINAASNSQLRVGDSLNSCTTEIEPSKEFIVDGQPVFLTDTPGFDETKDVDADTLKRIGVYLEQKHKAGTKLEGALFFHSISNIQFTETSTRNFKRFKKLCEESGVNRVIFVTGMWGVGEQHVEEAEERELVEARLEPALKEGAQLAHHFNTTRSAHEIIRRIIKDNPVPLITGNNPVSLPVKNNPRSLLIQQNPDEDLRQVGNTPAGGTANE